MTHPAQTFISYCGFGCLSVPPNTHTRLFHDECPGNCAGTNKTKNNYYKMKQVKIKTLKIINFKGIKSLTIDFSQKTDISGDNATGKTTIFDAVTWCFFGKNSLDAKDFDIKNTAETSLNRSDHSVEIEMTVDNEPVTLRRVY